MKNSKWYEENLYAKVGIRTFTGIYIDVFNPTTEMFCIEDIAHSLSMIPRFGGHLPIFYSVAEHCINGCSLLVNQGASDNVIFDFLMHDCSEAYLMDLPSPVKKGLEIYYDIESKLMEVASEVFGFSYPLCQQVKDIDKFMLEYEWNEIMIDNKKLESKRYQVELAFIGLYNSYKPK